MKKTTLLRKKHPEFVYENYSYKFKNGNFLISFYFSIKPDLKFKTDIILKNIPAKKIKTIDRSTLENLVFHLGLIEMLNYWKLTCSPKIFIKAGNLTKEGKQFLRKVILKGMGQYFYENKIDFTRRGFLKIEDNPQKKLYRTGKIKAHPDKVLIPIGGGKDSIVVLESEKPKAKKIGIFLFNPKSPQKKVAKISKIKEIIVAQRKIDPKLFELNSKGYLNGHVPFSAFLSLLTLLTAYISGYSKIAFAWEKSANEPNLKYKKRWINHQWSKSTEFETIFNDYRKKFLIQNIRVYSPIRNLSDLEIAKIFSRLTQYHRAFLSCNNAFKISARKSKWCGKCPKCLFVFASLYPFLKKEQLINIFGKNLFEDKDLLPIMLRLIGKKKFKPFECVGTAKESMKIFSLCLEKDKKEGETPYLLREFQKFSHK